jgi:two-component system, NarL family, response regulator NreC
MTPVIQVLLAEDHKLVRDGLRALLTRHPDIRIVGEVADGRDAVEALRRHTPDVLLADIRLPGLSGLELTRIVSEEFPGTRVVILTMHDAEAFVAEAFAHGAMGYVVKEAGADEVVDAIREVAAGRRFLSAALTQQTVSAYLDRSRERLVGSSDVLTEREREVLRHSARGLTARQVAAQLGISDRTVETHRRNLMRKLGCHRRSELVLHAVRLGVITTD